MKLGSSGLYITTVHTIHSDSTTKYARTGLPPPDKDMARAKYLREGIAAPDLATVNDFLRFYIATSKP
jgi:hypothetical protein